MNLYNYDENTKEYLYTSVAEADPEETKIQGKFIPLIPANCTEIQIPTYNSDNQIPVFENDNWVIKSDYRKNYYKVNNNLNVENITTIGEQEGYYIVDKSTGEDIKQNSDWYKISSNNIVKKSGSEYEAEQVQKERQRLDFLILTPSDVERALYYSPLQMDFDDLKALIAEKAPQIDLKGLAIEFRANNFYRGAVDKDGNRIIDMVGAVLGYTPEDMDYLFEHKQLPVHEKETVNEEETVEEPEAEATTEELVTEPTVEETAKE